MIEKELLSKKSATCHTVMSWKLNSCTIWLRNGFSWLSVKRKTKCDERFFS